MSSSAPPLSHVKVSDLDGEVWRSLSFGTPVLYRLRIEGKRGAPAFLRGAQQRNAERAAEDTKSAAYTLVWWGDIGDYSTRVHMTPTHHQVYDGLWSRIFPSSRSCLIDVINVFERRHGLPGAVEVDRWSQTDPERLKFLEDYGWIGFL